MDEKVEEVLVEVSKEIAKETYNDAAKPIIKPTGQIAGLVPRAIKAALLPVEKWILGREYNLEETKKLLEIKLQKVHPELIEAPEPYIAVPAIQYISYCMDSEELRNMYANLLANSMNTVVKNEVHPGFVEIIKQLSPDEAKIMKVLFVKKRIPTITVRYRHENNGQHIDILKNFSIIGEEANCEERIHINKYFDNLERLGLIAKSTLESIGDKKVYEPLKNHSYIKSFENIPINYTMGKFNKFEINESYIRITEYGEQFCKICIES